ncbi:MAG: hypothetical protein ACRDNW_28235, partial [Trebonia sp.]
MSDPAQPAAPPGRSGPGDARGAGLAARGEQTRARYPDQEGFLERDGVRVFYEAYGTGEPT